MDGTTDDPTRVPPDAGETRVVLDGRALDLNGVVRLADAAAAPAVPARAFERARRSWRAAGRLAADGRLYGRGTGVGAHRSVPVDAHDEGEHGLRILRSHAGGAGALLPARQVRAMLAIRANQLLAGGSGIQPAFVTALTDALRLGVHPAVNEYGGLGTGDLTALAQTGLTLIGERPWLSDPPEPGQGRRPEPGGGRPEAQGGGPEAYCGRREAHSGRPRTGGAPEGDAEPRPTAPTPYVIPGPRAGDGERPGPGALQGGLPAQWRGEGGGEGGDGGEGGERGASFDPDTGAGGLPAQWRGADGGDARPGVLTAGRPASPTAGGGTGPGAPGAGPPAGSRDGTGAGPGVDAPDAPDATAAAAARLPAQWRGGHRNHPPPVDGAGRLPAPVVPQPGDALALLSSNALTLGQAALACHDLGVLLRGTHAVAALSLAAVSGSLEAYAAELHALRPYPGAARAAAEVRRLLGVPDRPRGTGRRIQDPFGFRAFPQAHGPALDAADALRRVVEAEVNCPSENPLITPDGTAAYHHGGFYAAPLGLALDALNLAVLQTARLSAARLTALGRPDLTGLPAFLAVGPASSSGTMILEYTANSALAELRLCATPASAGHAVLSHGLEEAASFASQAARQSLRAVDAYATVLACELVCSVRALRLRPAPPATAAFTVADTALASGTEDRPLTADVTAATEVLWALAEL
ncbi:aromatic amino acid ammonia-lyase [Streptomyces sp. MMS24-I31]|uniref:aromatic amino acid ammonia-lyase n=1 Tax=Streptomyces sp. MMS24-I31 TaxID=3351563 RepID=UPI003896BB8F